MSTSLDNEDKEEAFFAAISAGDVAMVCENLEQDPSLVGCESLESPDMCSALAESNVVWTCVKSQSLDCLDLVLSCLRATRGEAIAEKALQNALYWATSYGCESVTLALLQRGADASVPNAQGETLLMLAARNNSVASVRALLPLSDVNAKSSNGSTAMDLAVTSGNADCVELLSAHPDEHQKKRNQLALLYASVLGFTDGLRLVLPYCDLSKGEEPATMALMFAAGSGQVQCLRELLPYWEKSARSSDGDTAWMRTVKGETPGVVECLEVLSTAGLSLSHAKEALDVAIEHKHAAAADWLAAHAGLPLIRHLSARWQRANAEPIGEPIQEIFPRSWAVWERQKLEDHVPDAAPSTEGSTEGASDRESDARAKRVKKRL